MPSTPLYFLFFNSANGFQSNILIFYLQDYHLKLLALVPLSVSTIND